MTLDDQISALTVLIDTLWAKSPERDPNVLTKEERKEKAHLVEEKRALCRQRWLYSDPELRVSVERFVDTALHTVRVNEAMDGAGRLDRP